MSNDRIPCPNCGALILEVTAKHNEGLCSPCKRIRDSALLKRREQEARRHAPKPPINYSGFTKKEFIRALVEICLPHRASPAKVSRVFLGFCDPILHQSSRFPLFAIFFHRRELYANLKRIPRPYRELIALYQARGMVTSDGFESYVDNTTSRFDREVDRGLALLGQQHVIGVLSKARKACKLNEGELPKAIDDELWKTFCDSMVDFESEFLGKKLMDELTNAEQAVHGNTH